MKIKLTDVLIKDIRFPTSRELIGSDAMNIDPDYSAAYVILKTNYPSLEGHGLTFTIGRGNEICTAAIQAFKAQLIGIELETITKNMGAWWHNLTHDSQLRWIGPEKGVIHLATAALVNAVWDLWAKSLNKPLWRLLADLSPEEFIKCVDFSYISDALSSNEAYQLLLHHQRDKSKRINHLLSKGYPAYSTSAGWLGYDDKKMELLCTQLINEGWQYLKLKVGADINDDIRRLQIARKITGPDFKIMIDANQKWDVQTAIDWMEKLAEFNPWWIEEPTNPDDILGHATIRKAIYPIKVATGEHCHNRIMFKQFFQANAIDVCQIDSCRLGGVNEVLAVMLMAAKFNVPVCPHAGGVGLCEYVQHLSFVDYICISASLENRVIEYVDKLHEHFISPVKIQNASYAPPLDAGYSITMHANSLQEYEFPTGMIWAS